MMTRQTVMQYLQPIDQHTQLSIIEPRHYVHSLNLNFTVVTSGHLFHSDVEVPVTWVANVGYTIARCVLFAPAYTSRHAHDIHLLLGRVST